MRVEPRGKNLVIHFDDGRSLVSHMRMTGSWHVYRPGERWFKPAWQAKGVIETDDYVAVCFNAPVFELTAKGGAAHHPTLSTLGPDVLAPAFYPAEARRRLRRLDRISSGRGHDRAVAEPEGQKVAQGDGPLGGDDFVDLSIRRAQHLRL